MRSERKHVKWHDSLHLVGTSQHLQIPSQCLRITRYIYHSIRLSPFHGIYKLPGTSASRRIHNNHIKLFSAAGSFNHIISRIAAYEIYILHTIGFGIFAGILYGIPAWCTPDDAAEFIAVEGGEVEYLTFYNPDILGSGTILIVTDSNGDIQEVYLLALRGDMDGDADLTSDDVSVLRNVIYGIRGFEYDDPDNENFVILPACDLTGDYSIDLDDSALLRNMFVIGTPVDQAYGGEVE